MGYLVARSHMVVVRAVVSRGVFVCGGSGGL